MENTKNNIIFPEESPKIIDKILKEYNLQENDDQFWQKFEKGEKTNSEIVAELAVEALEKDFSLSELIAELRNRLNVSQEIVEKIASDLKKQIFELVVLAEPKENTQIENTFSAEKVSEKNTDSYRENF